ncbi:MAG: cache domain-containing protein [Salinivirgaceae bacterium]|jgi:PAS domain S-box-containing protein
MKYSKQYQISSLFLKYIKLVSFISILLMISAYSIIEILDFSKKSQLLREEFQNTQKQIATDKTNKIIEYINLSRLFLDDKMNRLLYERTNEAWSIIDNIYQKYRGTRSKSEIKLIVKESLRPIRFNNQRGYYFIVSLDGVEELYPTNPEFEGMNLLGLQDDMGNYVVKDELEIVNKFGEGFVTGYWKKPGDKSDKIYPKTSFVKVYKPLGVYIGCGEYLDDMMKDIQNDAMKSIRQMRFDNDSYEFIYTFNGDPVITSHSVLSDNKNIWDTTDAYGVKIMQEMRNLVNNLEGGYLTYHLKKPDADTVVQKLIYCRAIHDWEWIVGSRVCLDRIETVIAKDKQRLYEQLILNIIVALSFAVLIYIFILVLMRKISNNLQSNFQNFSYNLEYSITTSTEISNKDTNIKDFIPIIDNINTVISKKKTIENQLITNESLFRVIFDNVPIMIVILDSNRNTMRWNLEVEKYFFVSSNEYRSFSIPKFQKQANIESLKKVVLNEKDSTEGDAHIIQFETKEGIRYQNWTAITTKTDNIVLVGMDVTDIKNQEETIKNLNDAMDAVFSIISKDLYDPFSSVIGVTQTLLAKFDELSDDEKKLHLTQVNTSSTIMNTQLQKLIQWSKIQSDSLVANISRINLFSTIDEVVTKQILYAHLKQIEIKNNVDPSIKLNADPILLEIVIQNILSNAIMFTNKNGSIEISAIKLTQNTTIIISDNGIGMTQEQIENIFDMAKTPRRKGTANEIGIGLGLIICKAYVEKMNGYIWIESTVDGGTTVYVQL